ncbi:Gfo/Idh/MocA family oxidoreductase [Phragmitibacter flavus]|uniref:Gfo/Idh/MocA family oxidoreductase n=1 Tax=Phragmitibacter flavus TaxID=2576071 RepID=A0A5R8KH89_9BACT|nr:Gfo/Idh/MocA family oxidoreductase [Phragmitibacter flavus]TLD71627.1 Gfo/Idh/MocA family oxidoreductase [Phragmitibacter flavus]
MKKYKVGIIGYGWAAGAHIAAINATSQAQVTAVYSTRKLDNVELSARHGCVIATYTDFDQFLEASGVDVVDICSMPSFHHQQAVAAAKAGKHIILEKPMGMTLEQSRDIVAEAEAAGVKGCVCFECRYSSQFLSTKAVLDQGLLGDLHYAEVDYYHGIGPWYGQFRWNIGKENGGSSLLTAGCHALDALLLCMGENEEVDTVTSISTKSSSDTFAPYEFDTTSVTLLHFKSGKIGKCASVVDCLQPYYFHTHLVGSEGSLLDHKFHSRKLHTDKNHWSTLSMKTLDSGDVSDHPYQTQFQAFFDALDQGQDMPLTSFKDALRTCEVLFAADQSAASGGKPVKLG